MDDTQDQVVEEVQEAEIVTESAPSENHATVVLSLEELIKNNISMIDKLREEVKKNKQQHDDSFENNPTYRELTEKAKEATKAKAQVHQEIAKQPSVAELANKVKEQRQDLKERVTALSDYLQEYERLTGAHEIEDNDGELRDIVKTAKVVKRSAKSQQR